MNFFSIIFQCREIGYETHEEILRVLQELHTIMKTYHTYQTECKEAEKKLRTAETQRTKLQQSVPKEKLERSKKYRVIEKEVLKVKTINYFYLLFIYRKLDSLHWCAKFKLKKKKKVIFQDQRHNQCLKMTWFLKFL